MSGNRRNALFLLAVLIVLVIFVLIIRAQRRAAVSEIDEEECQPVCPSCSVESPVGVACGQGVVDSENNEFDLDLKTAILPNTPDIDWSTLNIDNTEVATYHPFTLMLPTCDEQFASPADAPFGTYTFYSGSIPGGMCGAPTQNSPTSYTWNGCDTVAGAAGPPTGETYGANWTDAGDGVLHLALTSTATYFFNCTTWRITYSFQDVNGCSYTQVAYFCQFIAL